MEHKLRFEEEKLTGIVKIDYTIETENEDGQLEEKEKSMWISIEELQFKDEQSYERGMGVEKVYTYKVEDIEDEEGHMVNNIEFEVHEYPIFSVELVQYI